jgi:AcrR family transcriptional regulator
MPARTTSSATRPAGDTAELIESTALELFYENGYHGTSIRDIARAANIGIATLFHHHTSKAELLRRIVDHGSARILARIEGALADVTDPTERLATLVYVHVLHHCENLPEASVVRSELRSLEPRRSRTIVGRCDRIQELFSSTIVEGVEAGHFDCELPHETARVLHAMCSGVVGWHREDGTMTAEEVASHHAVLALRLVGARRLEPLPVPVRGL